MRTMAKMMKAACRRPALYSTEIVPEIIAQTSVLSFLLLCVIILLILMVLVIARIARIARVACIRQVKLVQLVWRRTLGIQRAHLGKLL